MARPRKVKSEIVQKDPEVESSVVKPKRGRPPIKSKTVKKSTKPKTKTNKTAQTSEQRSPIPGEAHFLSALKSFLLGIKCLVNKNLEMFPAEKKNTPPKKKKTRRKKVEDVTKKEE